MLNFALLKPLRSIIMLTAVLVPLLEAGHMPALAQERQGCFMVNSNGQLIDLSNICPSATPLASADAPNLGTGDIQVTLRWATIDDLDLAVTDPSSQTVYFGNPSIGSGGQLDVDANAGCGSPDATPIENIFWPTTQAPNGQYSVEVNLFSRCSGSGPIPFEIRLLVQGNVQTFTGVVSEQSPIATFPFSLPNP